MKLLIRITGSYVYVSGHMGRDYDSYDFFMIMATKKRRNYSKKNMKNRDEIKFDIILLIVIAVSLLLLLGEFNVGGEVIGVISRVTFGLFGILGYALPFIIFFVSMFIMSNIDNEYLTSKIVSLLFIFLFISAIADLFYSEGAGSNPISSYLNSYDLRNGGGFFGGLIAMIFYKIFGIYGAFIVSIIGIIIFLIVLSGRSFLKKINEYNDMKSGERSKAKSLHDKEKEEIIRQRQKDREERLEEEYEARALRRKEERERELEERKRLEEERIEREKTAPKNFDLSSEEIEPPKQERKEHYEPAHKSLNIPILNRINPFKNGTSEREISKTETENTISPDLTKAYEEAKKDSDGMKEIIRVKAPSMENLSDKNERSLDELTPGDFPEAEVSRVSINPNGSKKANENRVSEVSLVDREKPIDEDEEYEDDYENDESLRENPSRNERPAREREANYDGKPVRENRPSRNERPVRHDEPLRNDETLRNKNENRENSREDLTRNRKYGKTNTTKYVFPGTDLLKSYPSSKNSSESSLENTAKRLERTLREFGVDAVVTDFTKGPAVTRFEIKPNTGVKVSKIINLSDDIKLNLAVPEIRIEAPIPGKAAVGIEVPNKEASMVSFKELVESSAFRMSKSKIAFAAGKDIAGNVIISDIAKMPHVLIAGATGSGKSVCINTIIMSILYKATPDEVKFIMIDPKIVELSVYNGIPHLLVPVVTDPKKAAGALQWAVNEMTKRYQRFADAGVRDMKSFNEKVELHQIEEFDDEKGEKVLTEKKMPQIIVIVDELADLMMVASKEVESSICRLAQLARAAGIHLVIATQRPSVNVITGLIKANMPSRIAFAVSSGVDSRTILDMNGAEKLLGHGDMLYFPQGMAKPLRVQGTFVDDSEVSKVVKFIKDHNDTEEANGESETINKEIETHANNVSTESGSNSSDSSAGNDGASKEDKGRDYYFAEAGRLIIDKDKASIGMLQRYLKIGFNRAARIMDELGEAGVVGPEEGTKPRKVLMKKEEFEAFLSNEN